MQYRRLAGRERGQLASDYNSLAEQIEEYEAIIGSPALRQELSGTDRGRLSDRARPKPGSLKVSGGNYCYQVRAESAREQEINQCPRRCG